MIATRINSADWKALQELTGAVGLPSEQVGLLRKVVEGDQTRTGAPFTLIVGRPDAGIELLLARWIGVEVGERLKAGGGPIVLGPDPESVRPAFGTWLPCQTDRIPAGHAIAARINARGADALAAPLASLGHIDQLVLVVRLLQAMHEEERALLAAFAPLCATARVLMVGLPGEEVGASDIAEVTAFVVGQMRQAGFSGNRGLGTAAWFTGGSAPPGAITDPGAWMRVDAEATVAGRVGMSEQALARHFEQIRSVVASAPAPVRVTIAPHEAERLVSELGRYLADLGKRVADSADPSAAARDGLRGWGAYADVPGHWMKYVERLRPGAGAALLAEAEPALAELRPIPADSVATVPGASTSPFGRRTLLVKRLAVALTVGLVALAAASAVLGPPGVRFPGLVIAAIGYIALGLGAALGYAGALRFFPDPVPTAKNLASSGPTRPAPRAPQGWARLEARLLGWFAATVQAPTPTPVEVCRELSGRFGIEVPMS